MLLLMAKLAVGALTVGSSSFHSGAAIPDRYTCMGADLSPELHWSAPPAGTKEIAVLVEDPDAPGGVFIHWVLWGLPGDSRGLPEGATQGRAGRNDFGRSGWNGPCPPPGKPHHYHFGVYALDAKLDLPEGAGAAQLRRALEGHVLARGEVVGTFAR